MGCMNSIAHVQRQIDNIFRSLYVNDIVCGSKSVKEHLAHLRQLFSILVKYNVATSPKKTFLEYPDVALLSRTKNLKV